jgi:acyl-CoA thioesterase FadM
VVVLNGRVQVALVREGDRGLDRPPPARAPDLVVPDVAAATAGGQRRDRELNEGQDVRSVLAPPGSGCFLWSWRAPYFYCHFSDRVQHSAYVRALEEVVDRFLDARGLSVGRLLRERGWIPVVSRARVQLLAEAHMEETVHTTFVVEDVLKQTAYDARMDCYVQRGGALVHTATARILHGYAQSRGPEAGRMVPLDDETVAALTGRRRP